MNESTILVARIEREKMPSATIAAIQKWASMQRDGSMVEITMRRWYPLHSEQQRAYWFAVIVPIIANDFGYDPDEAHSELMWALWPEGRSTKAGINGGVHRVPQSFSTLARNQVSELFERVYRFAAGHGIYIPSPNEYIDSMAP